MTSASPRNVLVTIANKNPDGHAEVGSSDLQATTEAQMDIVGYSSSNIGGHIQPLYYHTVCFFSTKHHGDDFDILTWVNGTQC